MARTYPPRQDLQVEPITQLDRGRWAGMTASALPLMNRFRRIYHSCRKLWFDGTMISLRDCRYKNVLDRR